MANSSIINTLKNKIIRDIVNNEDIVMAIDSPDYNNPKWDATCMIDTPENIANGFTPLLFKSLQNKFTIDKVQTFLCLKIDLNSNYLESKALWNIIRLEIWIISHNDHLRINNIPTITSTRVDYIAELLDRIINNNYKKYGTLKLISTSENPYNENFYYRRLIFEGRGLNYSVCDD